MTGEVFQFEKGLVVKGQVTFQNVKVLIGDGLSAIQQSELENIIIECSGLGSVDNSFLTLCLSWFRCAEQSHKTIQFIGLGEALRRLINLTGLDQLINIK